MTDLASLHIQSGLMAAELADLDRMIATVFGHESTAEDQAHEAAMITLDRVVTARVGGQFVGSGSTIPDGLTVPGGRQLPCAAVTGVAVRPDFRRRGILRGLMGRLLADAHDAGEPVAALWATEAGIYGRFGWGMATGRTRVTVPRATPLLRAPHFDGTLALRPVDDGLVEELAPIYAAGAVPGFLRRDAPLWSARLHYPASRRDGGGPLQCVRATGATSVDGAGYALFATKQEPSTVGMTLSVTVHELVATSPGALAALWAFVNDIDLSVTTTAQVATDGPVLHWLARPRQTTWGDGLWVRLVDVPAALTARSWVGPLHLVVELTDADCPWNAGRWALAVGPDGAECTRSTAPADLTLDTADLAALYLGGTTAQTVASAGRITEQTPGAVRSLSRAARGDSDPWCPQVF